MWRQLEPFHSPSSVFFTNYLSLQLSPNTVVSTVTLYVHARGRKKPIATVTAWESSDGIILLQPYRDTPVVSIVCRQASAEELFYTGPNQEEQILGILANTVTTADDADCELDRDSPTQPSLASGEQKQTELAPDEDNDENCDDDPTDLQIALSDVSALPGEGGNLVPTDVLLAAANIATPVAWAHVRLAMDHAFPELSNVLFCRSILQADKLHVPTLQAVEDSFVNFLSTFIAVLFDGLDAFEPLLQMAHGRNHLQTPQFWKHQLCYAMAHMQKPLPNHVITRVKEFRAGRSTAGRPPFHAHCAEAWKPFQAIYLFLPVQLAIRMSTLLRECHAENPEQPSLCAHGMELSPLPTPKDPRHHREEGRLADYKVTCYRPPLFPFVDFPHELTKEQKAALASYSQSFST